MTTVREFDPRWEDDDQLLDDLRQAVRTTEPMTEWVARLGVGAFAWQDVDAELELATLLYDSALDPRVVARQNGSGAGAGDAAGTYRTLLFEAPSGSVQVEKVDDVVSGQLMPAASRVVWAISATGEVNHAQVDEVGFFRLPRLPDGPLKLRWLTAFGTLVTDWFRL